MNILAFDTTLSACSIAIMADGKIIASSTLHERARQVERLFPMIEELLAEAKLTYHDLNAFAVTTGPGSFTGVRIGIAAAKGLRLATKLPVIGVTGLEVIARGVPQQHYPIGVILDARREQVFAQVFSADGTPLKEPVLLEYAAITDYLPHGKVLLAGNGKHLVAEYISDPLMAEARFDTPDADSLARVAASLLPVRPQGDDIAPLYIRLPDAKLPNNTGR